MLKTAPQTEDRRDRKDQPKNKRSSKKTTQAPDQRRQQIFHFLNDKHHPYKHKTGWHNFDESVKSGNAIVVQIDSPEQLGLLMREVNRINQENHDKEPIGVRAVAGWERSYRNPVKRFFNCIRGKNKESKKYAASYSLNKGAVPSNDPNTPGIIIQFSSKFQQVQQTKVRKTKRDRRYKDGSKGDQYVYKVRAGTRWADLEEQLEKPGSNKIEPEARYAVPVASLIKWTTPIGLAATGGHGSLVGNGCVGNYIYSMTVMAPNGDLYKFKEGHYYRQALKKNGQYQSTFKKIEASTEEANRFFHAMRAGHMGMFGIVIEAEFECEPLQNMKEQVRQFNTAADLKGKWQDLFSHEHFSLIYHPPYLETSETPGTAPYQAKLWDHTNDEVTGDAVHSGLTKMGEELLVEVSEEIFDVLTCCFPDLIPYVTRLAAKNTIGARGLDDVVGKPTEIIHAAGYHSFPNEDLHDISYFLAVDEANAPKVAQELMDWVESYLIKVSHNEPPEYPITLSTFLRKFKGQEGGLSPSAAGAGKGKTTLSFDVVTHPDAPGLEKFHEELQQKLRDMKEKNNVDKISVHLGKINPKYVKSFEDILGKEQVVQYQGDYDAYRKAIKRHSKLKHDIQPTISPYMEKMSGIHANNTKTMNMKRKADDVSEATKAKQSKTAIQKRKRPEKSGYSQKEQLEALDKVLKVCQVAQMINGDDTAELADIRGKVHSKKAEVAAASKKTKLG